MISSALQIRPDLKSLFNTFRRYVADLSTQKRNEAAATRAPLLPAYFWETLNAKRVAQ